jgi:hypothetical protein
MYWRAQVVPVSGEKAGCEALMIGYRYEQLSLGPEQSVDLIERLVRASHMLKRMASPNVIERFCWKLRGG